MSHNIYPLAIQGMYDRKILRSKNYKGN